jgi:hemolysin activation/secretion protein
MTRWTLLGASLLGACATSTPAPSLEPTIGHSQPLPTQTTASSSESPPAVGGAPTTVMAGTPEAAPEPTEQPTEQPAEAEPPPPEQPKIPPPEQVTAEDEELCVHITRVVLTESESGGLTTDQVDELIASCSVALAQDRRKLGNDEFRRRAKCVRAASTVAGFSACQPD